jgi:hypothetical protein
MAFGRAAVLLSIAGILGMSGMGVSQASAATAAGRSVAVKASASVRFTPATGVRPLAANCDVTSNYGNVGQYICATKTATATWYDVATGAVILYDNLVIGTDYHIYHDSGGGWSVLQNGAASSTADPTQIGIFLVNFTDTIGVVGTDNRTYCNTTTSPGVWAGWRTC